MRRITAIIICMAWSRKHDRCLRCGTQTQRHIAKGYCFHCYPIKTEKRHKSHIPEGLRKRGILASVSRDDLTFQYENLNMSLSDLARKYNCTRQYIHKLLKQFGIRRRDKTKARRLALEKGKIAFIREDEFGIKTKVTLQKTIVNKDYFKSWSPAMAYVLGVIYTDGNLTPSILEDPKSKTTIRTSRFTVSQKEPELLQKILRLMGSNAKLLFNRPRSISGPIYYFHIHDDETYKDLLRLGLRPAKSLSLDFPPVPMPYVRHFVRGCWDGDGSIFWERDNPNTPRASFTSGSQQFVKSILDHLVNLGLPRVKLYHYRKNVFDIKFNGIQCVQLYHVFYDGVHESMYLVRKYKRFSYVCRFYESMYRYKKKLLELGY